MRHFMTPAPITPNFPIAHGPRLTHFWPTLVLTLAVSFVGAAFATAAPQGLFALDLPDNPVPDRVAAVHAILPQTRETWATLEGPGCIHHIWVTMKNPNAAEPAWRTNRKIVMRIFFDDSRVPQVEAPVGDFFGLLHGVDYYDINNQFISVQAWSGYNCYFEMPFAKNARVEFETGDERVPLYFQLDWHRYPDAEMKETRRFCASWRREMPTQKYGENFLMLDADGPGQLIGFFYGVRLIDNTDRWSHGGAENIYLDGLGAHPAYIRGIGGEDTFGTSYGGVLHPPETHLYTGLPYYKIEDIGEARGAQRVTGYRFFVHDAIRWQESAHMRFGTMENDVCATVYWYQSQPLRPFVKLPPFAELMPGVKLPRGAMDLPLPDSGSWHVQGPLENPEDLTIKTALAAPLAADFHPDPDWTTRPANHGYIDFNLVYRPEKRGVGVHYTGKAAQAACVLEADRDLTAQVRIAWDDHAILRVNTAPPIDLGVHAAFRDRTIEVPLKKGRNAVLLTLSNETGSNHGGWAFAFKATTPDGKVLLPQALR